MEITKKRSEKYVKKFGYDCERVRALNEFKCVQKLYKTNNRDNLLQCEIMVNKDAIKCMHKSHECEINVAKEVIKKKDYDKKFVATKCTKCVLDYKIIYPEESKKKRIRCYKLAYRSFAFKQKKKNKALQYEKCKSAYKDAKFSCKAQFQQVMKSKWDITSSQSNDVGKCFTDAVVNFKSCTGD